MSKTKHHLSLSAGFILLVIMALTASCRRESDLAQFEAGDFYSGNLAFNEYVIHIDDVAGRSLSGCLYKDEASVVSPCAFTLETKGRGTWIVKADCFDKPLKLKGSFIGDKVRCLLPSGEELLFSPIVPDTVQFRSQYLYPTFDVKTEHDVRYAHAEGYWTSYPDEDKSFAQIYFARLGQLIDKEDLDLCMDIYEPATEDDQPRPLVVFIHGGSFYNGDKADEPYRLWCSHFASMGYVAASINYRMGWTPSSKHIDAAGYRATQDANAALRYLVSNASRYNINTDWIFVGGSSAGAITALNMAFLNDLNRPASVMEEGSVTKLAPECDATYHIAAIVNMWGAVCDTSIMRGAHTSIISFHGDADPIIPYGYGFPFVTLLSNIGSGHRPDNLFGRLMSDIMPSQDDTDFWRAIISPMYGSSCIDTYCKAHGCRSELHTVAGGGHSMHVDEHRNLVPYFYTIQDSTALFLYSEMVPHPIRLERQGITGYAIDATDVAETHWQAEGGAVTDCGDSWARMLFFADEPIHKAIVSGRYTSGIEFKEEIVVE